MKADEIEVVQTRVFAASQNGGNPCPVIPFAEKLTDRQLQRLARKFGLDTAFILHPRIKGADIRLRTSCQITRWSVRACNHRRHHNRLVGESIEV